MKNRVLFLCFCVCHFACTAQVIKQYTEEKTGLLVLTPTLSVPYENAGYTLILPDDEKAEGLIVFLNSDRDTLNKIFRYALPRKLAVAYVTTGNRFEFFFETAQMQQIEQYLHDIITTYHIPKENLLFLGMSLAGTRAIKQAIFAQQPAAKYHLKPKAIAACDAPLDFVRFWKELKAAMQLNINPIAANEGTWVTAYLEKNLGGTPAEALLAYQHFSPFSYSVMGLGNEKWLKDIAIRAYTEPDVQWWMENRGKDYYGMNAIDAAALINALRLQGNDKVELILTQNKGYRPDGTRHPHSWSIVDEQELVDWFVGLLE